MKFKSKLAALAAATLVAASFSAAINPVSAAQDPDQMIWAKADFEFNKSLSVTSKQKLTIKNKMVKISTFTKMRCELAVPEQTNAADLKKAKIAAKSVCSYAKTLNKNIALQPTEIYPDEDIANKKFRVWVGLTEPRMVSFGYTPLYDGVNPPNTKALKYNASYTIPQPPVGMTTPGGDFVGWNTQWDGSGRAYNPGQKIKVKSALVLHPIFKGYEIQIELESLDTAVGSQVNLRFTSPGDYYTNTNISENTVVNASKVPQTQLSLHVPGSAHQNSFELSEGIEITYIGWGTCPDKGFVNDECTVVNFSYQGDGTINFYHQDLE